MSAEQVRRADAVFGVRQPNVQYTVRRAAYAVILDDRHRVACVQEESGRFLPGGGLEPGESDVDAIHREVMEECGRSFDIVERSGAAVQFFISPRGEPFELRAVFFLGRFGPGTALDMENAVEWLPAAPEPPQFFHECHRWAVRQASGTIE
jgi:8-oxo-dGTP diphosphatase